VEAVRHATAHILARDAEFDIALRQDFANSARQSVLQFYKSDSRFPDFTSPLQP
jgi:hypothetical protein